MAFGPTGVDCPHCGAHFEVPGELAGLPVHCRTCDRQFAVPASAQVDVADAEWRQHKERKDEESRKGLRHPLRRHLISSPILLAGLSAVMPFVGLIFGLLLRADDNQPNRRIGLSCLIAAGVGVVTYVVIYIVVPR